MNASNFKKTIFYYLVLALYFSKINSMEEENKYQDNDVDMPQYNEINEDTAKMDIYQEISAQSFEPENQKSKKSEKKRKFAADSEEEKDKIIKKKQKSEIKKQEKIIIELPSEMWTNIAIYLLNPATTSAEIWDGIKQLEKLAMVNNEFRAIVKDTVLVKHLTNIIMMNLNISYEDASLFFNIQKLEEKINQEMLDAIERRNLNTIERLLKIFGGQFVSPIQIVTAVETYAKQKSYEGENDAREILILLLNTNIDIAKKDTQDQYLIAPLFRYKLQQLGHCQYKTEARRKLITTSFLKQISNIKDVQKRKDLINSGIHSASDISLIKNLIDMGGDINSVDVEGNSILLNFISQILNKKNVGSDYTVLNTIKEIVQLGININLKNRDGNSALLLAAHIETHDEDSLELKYDIIKLLLEHNADINAVNNRNQTTLILVVVKMGRSSELNIVKLLIKSGAEINIRDTRSDGPPKKTALEWAKSRNDHNDLIEFLAHEESKKANSKD